MALDWSKEISFSGLMKGKGKGGARGKVVFPSKRYINLTPQKERNNDVRKVLPIAILVFLLVAAFVKFGIYDLYAGVAAKQAELNTQTQILRTAQAEVASYDEVKAEYEKYQSTKLASSDLDVSAIEAMQLVDTYIAPRATIDSIDYKDNTITLNLGDITLEELGKLVGTLYEQDIVANVAVSTAGADASKNEDLTASMVITVAKA